MSNCLQNKFSAIDLSYSSASKNENDAPRADQANQQPDEDVTCIMHADQDATQGDDRCQCIAYRGQPWYPVSDRYSNCSHPRRVSRGKRVAVVLERIKLGKLLWARATNQVLDRRRDSGGRQHGQERIYRYHAKKGRSPDEQGTTDREPQRAIAKVRAEGRQPPPPGAHWHCQEIDERPISSEQVLKQALHPFPVPCSRRAKAARTTSR